MSFDIYVLNFWKIPVKKFTFSVITRFKPATCLKKNTSKDICQRFWSQIYQDTSRLIYFSEWLFFRNTFSGCLPNKHQHFFSITFLQKGKLISKELSKNSVNYFEKDQAMIFFQSRFYDVQFFIIVSKC